MGATLVLAPTPELRLLRELADAGNGVPVTTRALRRGGLERLAEWVDEHGGSGRALPDEGDPHDLWLVGDDGARLRLMVA